MEPPKVDIAPNMSEGKAALLLVVVCGLLITVGVATSGDTATAQQPVALGDVSNAQVVEIRDARGAVVLTGEFRSQVDKLGNTEKDAPLSDRKGKTVIGEVELEIPAESRTNRRPELEVDVMGLPPRQAFSVVIDDRFVGSFTTDDRGSIDMELQEGEIPGVPGTAGFPGALPSACEPAGAPVRRSSSPL
jgi:hypothetical protein